MRVTFLFLLAAGALIAADAPKDEATKKDLEKMQGDWVMEAVETNGTKTSAEKFTKFSRAVKDDTYTVTIENEEGVREVTGKLTLNATQNPKSVDALMTNGALKDKTLLGIYKFDGDTQVICLAGADKKRPTTFDSKEGTIITWKRVKKAPAASLVTILDDSKLDKKALDIVKQVAELHKNAKSMQVKASLEVDMESGGQTRKVEAEADCELEQPNHFAFRIHQKDDKATGLEVVCDGKNLFTHALKPKQYTEATAPADLREMGKVLFQLGIHNVGMLFVNVLAADPYVQLMEGVNSCAYTGKKKIGKVDAHHLKFSQDAFDWEMWVAAEGKPFVLKMSTSRSGDDGKFAMVESYRDWKLDAMPGKDVFSFSAPKEATKVEKLDADHGKPE